jgi:hypothetical protein
MSKRACSPATTTTARAPATLACVSHDTENEVLGSSASVTTTRSGHAVAVCQGGVDGGPAGDG